MLSCIVLNERGSSLFDVSAGQLVMNTICATDLATSGLSLPASNDPVYLSGYLSGLFTNLFVSRLGESVSLGDVVQTEINGQPAAYTDLLGSEGLMRIIVSTKDEELFVTTVVFPQAEIAQWESLIFSIIESIEIHDLVESDTFGSSASSAAARAMRIVVIMSRSQLRFMLRILSSRGVGKISYSMATLIRVGLRF